MELIERYLQAIGQYLPAGSRNDILAELRSELLEQMDARAAEWGRPLDEADVAALLKVHGRPEVVALRYLPQRSLIGPGIFPFWWFTLARTLPLVILVSAIVRAVQFVSTPGESVGHAVTLFFGGLFSSLLITAALVTAVFAGLEWVNAKGWMKQCGQSWDPMKLPALKPLQPAKQKSFAIRVLELMVHVLWMLYVLAIPAHPFLILGPGAWVLRSMGIGLAPVWHPFFDLLIVMLSVQLVMKIAALRPGEQALLKPLEFGANLVGIIALALLAFARQLIVSSSPTANLQQLGTVNHALSLAFRVALFFAVFGLISELWKYLRARVHVRRQLAV